MSAACAAANPVPFSPLIFTCLLVILGSSILMYWMLVRRWTSHRQWVSLAEWARQSGFRVGHRKPADVLPAPFDLLGAARLSIRSELTSERVTILQVQSLPDDAAAAADSAVAVDPRNVLVRRIEAEWPPSGLRPVGHDQSLLDLFSLASFPLMGTNQRFVVFGTDSAAARTLAQSSVRALLPQDVGLLLHGRHLLLDFSTRPFDSLEFTRMLTLAEQLVNHLPAVKGGA